VFETKPSAYFSQNERAREPSNPFYGTLPNKLQHASEVGSAKDNFQRISLVFLNKGEKFLQDLYVIVAVVLIVNLVVI
jgi:hypothetical protein